ncbi:methyltransferase domain-containing protein [Candidatus Woesearchaeota archaeon]|nr:methyltransferase domain-containing protein [Candidatus Woesearchaeota archaeon]
MTNLKQALKKKLTKKEIDILVRSYDVVGDIAIIEIPAELEKKEKIIAKELLGLHKNIKVVAKKADIHKGIYRRRKLKILAGERRKTTESKENNVRVKLHVEDVYYSIRSSTERKRIMEQVKKGEEVLIMFSGAGPYCLVIAKNTKAKSVYGIEINPIAHKFALESLKLNKLENVKLYKGDVRLIVPRLKKKFDRIAMPLPKSAEGFLDVALKAIKKKGIIHFYDFEKQGEFELAKAKVKKACAISKKRYRVLKIVKAGQVGPREYRLCVDFKILS